VVDRIDPCRSVLVVRDRHRTAAHDPVAARSGPVAVIGILEVAEIIFVQEADFGQYVALQVGAGKHNTFHIAVVAVLIDVLLPGADLLPPERVQGM